jgi:hypothetical protein
MAAFTYKTIDPAGATLAIPSGINASGQIVGYPSFLYSDGLDTTIDFPGSPGTFPLAINSSFDSHAAPDRGPRRCASEPRDERAPSHPSLPSSEDRLAPFQLSGSCLRLRAKFLISAITAAIYKRVEIVSD